MSIVDVRDLTVVIRDGREDRTILDRFSFTAPSAAMTVLAGPSGSGKTTALSCIAGFQAFQGGSIRIGNSLRLPNKVSGAKDVRSIGFVFQDYHLLRDLNVIDNVAMPLTIDGYSWAKARKHCQHAIESLDLKGLEHALPNQLSGGERQRVAFARAIARHPEVLLADEPTAHLDDQLTAAILELLGKAIRDGLTVLVTSHDQRVLAAATSTVTFEGSRRPSALVSA